MVYWSVNINQAYILVRLDWAVPLLHVTTPAPHSLPPILWSLFTLGRVPPRENNIIQRHKSVTKTLLSPFQLPTPGFLNHVSEWSIFFPSPGLMCGDNQPLLGGPALWPAQSNHISHFLIRSKDIIQWLWFIHALHQASSLTVCGWNLLNLVWNLHCQWYISNKSKKPLRWAVASHHLILSSIELWDWIIESFQDSQTNESIELKNHQQLMLLCCQSFKSLIDSSNNCYIHLSCDW